MTSSPDTVEIKKAGPPFDDQEADVIIRSSDNVDFYVFKAFLGYSSSVFKDMFCVAQGNPEKEELQDGLQVIVTDGSAEMWKILLRFAYPLWAAGPPALDSLDEFAMALESSRKYGMSGAERLIVADLVAPRFLVADPMRVFALACQFGLTAEATLAGKQSLSVPSLGRPYIAEMAHMTVKTYHQLHQYRLQCAKVASQMARNPVWIDKWTFVWFGRHVDCGKEGRTATAGGGFYVASWWYDYMQSAATALEDRPVGATVTDSVLMGDALRNASYCSSCSPRAVEEMKEFAEMFAAEIDNAVAKVELDVQL